jgi:hypothetical protein
MALLPLRNPRLTTRRKTVHPKGSRLLDSSTSLGLRSWQQQPGKLSGSMHRLSLGDAPKTAGIDLGGSRRTSINRRASFATTGNAKEAGGCAVGIVWKL